LSISDETYFHLLGYDLSLYDIRKIKKSPLEAAECRVNILKSISARELFRRHPHLKEVYWSGKIWEDGYFVRAVGEKVSSQIIQEYIRYQRESRARQPLLFHDLGNGEP